MRSKSYKAAAVVLGTALVLYCLVPIIHTAAAAPQESMHTQVPLSGDPGVVTVNGVVQAPHTATCVQPPAGVDLTTLSDAQLALYNLPSRAEFAQLGGDHLALWHTLISHARRQVCSSGVRQPGPIVPGKGARTKADDLSPDWGGYENTGGGYQYAETSFVIPTVQYTSTPYGVAFWTGIGGDYGDTLAQDGVQGYSNTGCCTLWWTDAYYGYAEQPIELAAIGDQIYVSTDVNYHVSGCNYFYLQDITYGFYKGITECHDLPQGQTADYITEDNGDSGLANFGRITFAGNYAVRNGAGNYFQSYPLLRDQMYDGHYLVTVYNPNGTSFDVAYLRHS